MTAIYLIIVIALTLACVAVMQGLYIIFLQTMARQDRKRIVELERELKRARRELNETHQELESVTERLEEAEKKRDDSWPEVIDG